LLQVAAFTLLLLHCHSYCCILTHVVVRLQVCAYHEWNLDGLVEMVWEYLDLVRWVVRPCLDILPSRVVVVCVSKYVLLTCKQASISITLHVKQETTSTGTSFFRKFPGAENHIPTRIALQKTSVCVCVWGGGGVKRCWKKGGGLGQVVEECLSSTRLHQFIRLGLHTACLIGQSG